MMVLIVCNFEYSSCCIACWVGRNRDHHVHFCYRKNQRVGIMKAIGTRNSTILALFLVEALIIGLLGAVIGLLVGVGGGYALVTNFTSSSSTHELLSNLTPVFLINDLIRIFGISVGLSVGAGLYPAWKASRLSPIAALRRE